MSHRPWRIGCLFRCLCARVQEFYELLPIEHTKICLFILLDFQHLSIWFDLHRLVFRLPISIFGSFDCLKLTLGP